MEDCKAVILFVEENDEAYELGVNQLRQRREIGLPVVRVNNAKDAVQQLYNSPPFSTGKSKPNIDLIILDLKMADIGGTAFLRSIRNNRYYKHTPVIIYSDTENPNIIYRCYQLGVEGIVRKSGNPGQLPDLVENVLYKKQSFQPTLAPLRFRV